ncbi:MAG: magnesium transporter [Granulosicoccus sp.]|jgi:magnesium transporter
MQFELTADFLADLKNAVARADSNFVSTQVAVLHPADIADILDEIDLEEAKFIYRHLEEEVASDTMMELDDDVRVKFLESLSDQQIAQIIDNLDTDDATDLVAALPEERQEEVLEQVEDEEQVSDIQHLLSYDAKSVGGLMAKELIQVNMDWTVLRCVREMRKQAENVDSVYTIYVVDNENYLKGIVSLRKMLLASERTMISDIFKEDVLFLKADMDAEEAANFVEKYDLVVVPVVDDQGKLIGRVTVDDLMDVVREETSKDYQMLSGISKNVESSDSIWVTSRARLPWLLIAMAGGIVGALVIGNYEEDLKIRPEMAFFIPLVVAMGGNVGIQSSSLVVQGLANNTMGLDGIFKKVIKELGVGLFNGIACTLVLLIYSFALSFPLALSLTIGSSLLAVILFAAGFGTFIPLVLKKYGFDPALATGPFITTSNDIIGLFFYFILARMIYSIVL